MSDRLTDEQKTALQEFAEKMKNTIIENRSNVIYRSANVWEQDPFANPPLFPYGSRNYKKSQTQKGSTSIGKYFRECLEQISDFTILNGTVMDKAAAEQIRRKDNFLANTKDERKVQHELIKTFKMMFKDDGIAVSFRDTSSYEVRKKIVETFEQCGLIETLQDYQVLHQLKN